MILVQNLSYEDEFHCHERVVKQFHMNVHMKPHLDTEATQKWATLYYCIMVSFMIYGDWTSMPLAL